MRRPIAIGLGCDRGTPASTLVWALVDALGSCHATLADVAAVASIDLKADEPGLHALADWQGWTIRFYPAAALAAVPVPPPTQPYPNKPARPRSPKPRRCSRPAPAWIS